MAEMRRCTQQSLLIFIQILLVATETVVNKSLVNARIDFWEVNKTDFIYLSRWFQAGEHWLPPDATDFVKLTFPFTIADDLGSNFIRLETFYKGGTQMETGKFRFIFRPSGIGRIFNLESNVVNVCYATLLNTDGSKTCDLDYTLAPYKLLQIEAYSAMGLNTFSVEIQIVIEGTSKSIEPPQLIYSLPEKPVINMNAKHVSEIWIELVVLKPIITGSLPITGHWKFNGVRITDDPSAITVDTRLNATAYGLYQLYVENQFGSASFHVIVKPPFKDVFEVDLFVNGQNNRMQSAEVSHYVSGEDQRTSASFSELGDWIASFKNVVMTNSTKSQLTVLQTNVSKYGEWSLSAEISLQTMAVASEWSETWYKTTYNYSLLANENGRLGGMISFSHMISDDILWVYDVNTSINTTVNKAVANVSVQFEDKALNARNGLYPNRVPFNVSVMIALEEGSNRPIHNVNLGLQIPTSLIRVLDVKPILRCSSSYQESRTNGLVNIYASSLNFEEAIELTVSLIVENEKTKQIGMWMTSSYCSTKTCDRPNISYRILKINTTSEVNLALKKTASQISVASGHAFAVASKAVDGDNTSNLMTALSCSHTANQLNAWWQVDLDYRSVVKKVIMYNRMDCCSQYLTNAFVTVRYDPAGVTRSLCGQVGNMAGVAVASVECPEPLVGRYIRIEILSGFLILCEVQVIGSYEDALVNLALRKNATQSSTYASTTIAMKAVDGNVESFSQTYENEVRPWWQVDLDYVAWIRKVIIYNRMSCCSERLSNVTATVGYELSGNNNEVCGQLGNMAGVTRATVECQKTLLGRYVRLALSLGTLSFAEVQVIGSYRERNWVDGRISYIISETDCRFIIIIRSATRKLPWGLVTENEGKSWIALPSFVYDIQAYDAEKGVLLAMDAQQKMMNINLKSTPWQVHHCLDQNPLNAIKAIYLNPQQLFDLEVPKLATKICSTSWLFTRGGIKENDKYIVAWDAMD